jgi:UDP-N-acetylmuramate dehydrogenase
MRERFGDQMQEHVSLAPYTSARIGGQADILVTARNSDELFNAAQACWNADLPFTLLGAGSNILVSDQGVRGLVILNKAKASSFRTNHEPTVWAESGVVLSNLAHRSAAQGFTGLEWAATVPGTVGGAVYGNAGAFGSDIAHNLLRAEILTDSGRAWWPVEKMEYDYRSSLLKHSTDKAIILSAEFRLKIGTSEIIKATIDKFTTSRKASQPPGASMGSMFKNPPGDFAGRLIESAGLKGTRIGNAEISTIHGNFFISNGETRAADVRALILLVQKTVKEKFNVALELEVELIGEWE